MPPAIQVADVRGTLPVRAGSTPYRTRALDAIYGGTVHYTAGSSTASVQDVAAFQTGPDAQLPFPAIAYAYYVDYLGVVHWCHDLDVRVWHSDGPLRNERYVAVCFGGDLEPTPAQCDGIARAFRHAELLLGRPLDVLEGHRQASQTACPGPTLELWLPDVRSRLEALR